MHVLNEKEFQLKVKPILKETFVGNDATEPFQTQVQERLLLYFPLGGYIERNDYWEVQLFKAIAKAAKSLNNIGCYLIIGWEMLEYDLEKNENIYAYIPISELKEAFVPLSIGLDKMIWNQLDIDVNFPSFCLCSANRDWGLLKTLDEHAFLGGTPEFIQAVKSYFPEIEQEVDEYLNDFKLEQMYGETIDIQWLKQLLSHVYDSVTAEKLLKKAKLL